MPHIVVITMACNVMGWGNCNDCNVMGVTKREKGGGILALCAAWFSSASRGGTPPPAEELLLFYRLL